MALGVRRPIFVKREHPLDTINQDGSTATETSSLSATSLQIIGCTLHASVLLN